MAKEIKYSPVSIISQVCGSIATMAAATNPALDASAVGIGTAASAIVGGIEISDKDENIKEKIDIKNRISDLPFAEFNDE